jgi:recombinational DNA repair protein (RecF pathway)
MDHTARTACAGCGEPLEQPAVGRRRKYCGEVCRRAAEYDLRRTQALLKRAEQRAQDSALQVHMAEKWQLSGVEKALAFWEGEVVRLRGVLRELLAGSGSLEQAG